MRISDSMMSGNFLANLNRTKDKIEKIRVEIAEGTKINRPSDSPAGAVKLLRLNNQYGMSETFSSNIDNGISFLKESTFAMETIQTEAVKVMSTMALAINEGNSNLNSFADQIDSSIKSMMDAANAQYDGKYIFGGTDHSTNPYSLNAAGTAVVENTDTSGSQMIKISTTSYQKINMTGKDIFGDVPDSGGNDIFSRLIKLRDDMRNGIRPTDADIIEISKFNLHVLDKISETGNIQNQLTDTGDLLNNHKLILKELISKEQDVDTAQAMVDLQNQDYLLQLSLKISSTILPKSLLDYL